MIMKKYLILFLCVGVGSVRAMERPGMSDQELCTVRALLQLSEEYGKPSRKKRKKSDHVVVAKLLSETHKGEKGLFKCARCSKLFQRRSICERHEKMHEKLKPFKCRYCDGCFTTKYNRDSHEYLHMR
jgi:hypothetical protein